MSHPTTRSQDVDGTRVTAKSFRTNAYFYESIGGAVEVRGEKRKRDWTCVWLCKKPVKVEADSIVLENQYYSRVEGTAVLVASARQEGQCSDAADCTLKHSAGGIGVKIKFPDGGASPGTLDDLLPIDGVVSRATVRVEGRTLTFTTASGAHPD